MKEYINEFFIIGNLLILSIIYYIHSKRNYNYNSDTLLKTSDIDYSDTKNWVNFDKDSDKVVDVFMIYPTISSGECEADKPFIRLECNEMKKRSLEWVNDYKELFESKCNIYAPLYRQLNGSCLDGMNNDEMESYCLATPRDDIFAAFEYFLKYINKNQRPFIIFGHSQGSLLARECATSFLGNPKYFKYNKNHIATYAIGFSVTQSHISRNPNLKFTQKYNDIGVIISWNTIMQKEIDSKSYKKFCTWNSKELTVNPISWRSDESYVSAKENKASKVLQDDGSYKMIKYYADAKVDKSHNVLLCNPPCEVEKDKLSNVGDIHKFDITYYFDSIKLNINDRIDAFDAITLDDTAKK